MIEINFFNNGSSLDICSILDPSDNAFSGFGCVSIKIPFTPAAIPAHANVSIYFGVPPDTPVFWFGFWLECVASKTTGTWYSWMKI